MNEICIYLRMHLCFVFMYIHYLSSLVSLLKVYDLGTLTLFCIAFILDNTGFLSFKATLILVYVLELCQIKYLKMKKYT